MAKFKVIVSDPTASKSKVTELDGAKAVPLIGKRLGETLDGAVVGMSGTKLQITGGSDKDGFPMRPSIHGGVRVSVILSKGVGFHPKHEGERQRKTLRGNVITEEIVQVNMKVLEKPKKAERPKRERKSKAKAEVVGLEKEATVESKAQKTRSEPVEPAQTELATGGGESSEEAAQTAGG
jgi:small subunit ribosomal protein S6e